MSAIEYLGQQQHNSELTMEELLRLTSTIAQDIADIKQTLASTESNSKNTLKSQIDDTAVSLDNITESLEGTTKKECPPPLFYFQRLRDSIKLMTSKFMLGEMATPSAADTITVTETGTDTPKVTDSKQLITGTTEVFRKGCAALLLYISKVQEQPTVPRYRRIATSNASYKALVEVFDNHDLVLAAVGFAKSSDGKCFEWIWGMESTVEVTEAVSPVEVESSAGGEAMTVNALELDEVQREKLANIDITGDPFPRPADDSVRAALLVEGVRLLRLGKEQGADILLADLDLLKSTAVQQRSEEPAVAKVVEDEADSSAIGMLE